MKAISEFKQITNRFTGKVMCAGLSLEVVIENHRKWLYSEEGGERANLRAANLSAADLRAADLRDADLRAANLSAANLRAANLRAANLSDADLRDADLRAANLSAANLRAANLRAADLSDADLRAANLRAANLSAADLRDADLRAANLRAANLRDADLRDADLRAANLSAAKNHPGLEGVPLIKDIHQAVYAAASQPGCFDMATWHCGTKHCRAGWVVTLAGEAGAAMEFCLGTSAAAALIYLKSDPKLEKIPDFFNMDNNAVLADMKRLAEEERAAA
jgi:hypothetical protein